MTPKQKAEKALEDIELCKMVNKRLKALGLNVEAEPEGLLEVLENFKPDLPMEYYLAEVKARR